MTTADARAGIAFDMSLFSSELDDE